MEGLVNREYAFRDRVQNDGLDLIRHWRDRFLGSPLAPTQHSPRFVSAQAQLNALASRGGATASNSATAQPYAAAAHISIFDLRNGLQSGIF